MNPNRSFARSTRIGAGLFAAIAIGVSIHLADLSAQAPGQVPVPIPGRNINMVSGTTLPGGDPFLQRQNEPSIAVSTRNPLHILGAANDYRTVDIPGLGEEVIGDAWIGIFKSFDGGSTWKSTLLPGFRQDVTPAGQNSPLYGLEAGADPVIRAGTHGLFYMAGMAFNRDQQAGRVFVARYIDNNNLEAGDSIAYLSTTVVDSGTPTRFLDKPWIAVDIPRAMFGAARTDADDRRDRAKVLDKTDKNFDPKKPVPASNSGLPQQPTTGPVCMVPGQAQPIPAGRIYVVYSAFLDSGTQQATAPHRAMTPLEKEREREQKVFGAQHREFEEHKQGVPEEGQTQIMLSYSEDCGATFSLPRVISDRTQINQGAVMAIDPNTGDLYVAWREFMSRKQPNAILITKSTDGGRTFSTPRNISNIKPFDQGTTPTSFRTNSYPTMAIDGAGTVYVAWADRSQSPHGDARIVVSTSIDGGRSWRSPAAVDNHPGRGHQIMPVLSFGGGKLHVVFWDQRDDVSKMWGEFIDEYPIVNWTGDPKLRPKRHTLDLRAASGWPGRPPVWGPTVKISNYLEGVLPGSTQPVQLQYHAPNLPLFSLGTKPFVGDYLDVTVAPNFIANGDGTWRFNTQLSDPAMYFTAWGDNRDVRPPQDGNWVHYTPPTFAGYTGTSIYDPTQPVEQCSAGQAGMRDQNVYSAKVSGGLIVATPGNNKPLGYVTGEDGIQRLIQRTFVITVSNPDSTVKPVVLHITAQPPGGVASFLQFEPLFDLPVDIAPKSSISREVFVTSTDPRATVPVTVTEGGSSFAAARLFLNPDPTNPDIDNPDIDNPDIDNPDIDNAEAHNITVSNPAVTNPDIDNIARANPDIDNPDIDNPDIDNSLLANLAILNPDIDNPDIDNPDIDNVDIVNPDIDNPDIDNPDIDNAALTDVTWNVSNVGNTTTAYQVKLLLKQAQQQRLLNAGVQFQLVVTKTTAAPAIDKCAVVEPNRNLTIVTINSPSFVDPSNTQQVSTIINPDIDNPDIDNATLALAPGDTARVTLRVYSPAGDTTTGEGGGGPETDPLDDLAGALEDLKTLGVATTSHPVDTNDVNAGSTTPRIAASIPLIITETLDDATRGAAYIEQIEQTGSEAPFRFLLATGALPPGLTLNLDGTITGTPLAAGAFTFTVRLVDANESEASATLTIRVFEPLQVLTGPLSGAGVGQAYTASLSALGGLPQYSWSLAGGALPAGVTLTPAGALTGTPTQSGSFSIIARAIDSAAPPQSAAGSFTVNVIAAAEAQSVTAVEDTPTPITLSASGGGPFGFAIGNQPAHGTVSGEGATFTYTPDLNYNGPDSFTFSAQEGELTSAFATVSIAVTPSNDPPAATPQTVNTPQGVAVPIVLSGTDSEDSPLTFSIFSGTEIGTLTGTAPNLTYTPPPTGFAGIVTFSFRANDGLVFSAPAAVTVIVGPPPENSADITLTLTDAPDPVALGGTVTYTATIHNNGPAAATGVTLDLAYPSSDLVAQAVTPSQGTCMSGNTIACAIGGIPVNGSVTVTVTMRAFNRGGTFNVSGTVSGALLDYNTSNNAAAQTTVVSGPATATSDLQVSQDRAPAPVDFGSNVVYTIVVANNGPSDATGVTLANTFTSDTAQFVSSTASQGSCVATTSGLTCGVGNLAGGASASYTLTLRANGSGSLSNTAVVSGSQLDPNAANNSGTLATGIANRTPVATNDTATTNEDTVATFMVVGNDSDPDSDPLTIENVGAALHGSAQAVGANGIRYEPAPNYYGPDSFTYEISDGRGGTATATVTVNVMAVNDAPVFAHGPDQVAGQNTGAHTVEGWASNISEGPVNEESQAVSFIVSNDRRSLFAVQPAVSPAGTLTFTPAAVGFGVATVTVTAVDTGGTDNGGFDSSESQTFTISITAGNVPPSFTAGPDVTINEDAGAFVPVNNEGGERNQHTATRLADGRVLIAGGAGNSGVLAGAELYDPTTRTQLPAGSMNVARVAHTATLLANGLVLIAGGANGEIAHDSAELFNPATGVFTPVTAAMTAGRLGHTATLLPDGRVLLAGGHGMDFDPLNSAEIFDPVANTFSLTGTLSVPRSSHSAVSLADGRVLVVAGYTTGILTTAAAEIYDPSTGLFTITGSLARARGGETATLLPNNMVLVAGGADETVYVLSSELYDPATGQFTAGPELSAGRYGYSAEVLGNGTVLLAGGRTGIGANDPEQYLTSAEIYNPATNAFSATGAMASARTDFRLTALGDGSVLASGGFNTGGRIGASELYVSPGPQAIPAWATAISAGPAHESGQAVDFIVTNDNGDLFSEQPTIDPDGTLSFRSVANAAGSATVTVRLHDDGGVDDGGVDTSAPQTFVITISPVNDAPSFVKGADLTLLEDAGPQFVPGWAAAMSVGPGNEFAQGLDFSVSTNNPDLFSGTPAIDAETGTLTFTPSNNAYGSATVSVHLHDSGGTDNGGVNVSPVQTFVVTVTPVNDPPRFNPLPGLYQVTAGAGPQTVPGWVTGISAGPANESAQSVIFLVTNENNAFFSVQPAISPDGTLSFTPAPGATGGATVNVRARDDGGTENDGNDTSLEQSFLIMTSEPQEADLAVAQTDSPDAAPSGGNFTYTMTVENLGPGTANSVVLIEDVSGVTFVNTSNPNCAVGPATRISCELGALESGGVRTVVATVTGPFGDASSVASVTANEADPNPANNTSTELTTIDTYPVAVSDSAETASGVAVDIDVLANDTDADIPAGDTLRVLTVGEAQHGTVTQVTGTGVLRYTPEPGFTGFDTFIYSIADSITLTSANTVTVLVTQAACVAEPSGLVSWWPGEANADDVRGLNTGTLVNGSYAPGQVGSAFNLNGIDQHAEIPNSPSLNPAGAFTVGGWFYIDPNAAGNNGDFSSLFSKSNGGSSGGGWYLAFEDRTGDNAISFAVFGASNLEHVHAPNSIPAAGWYHVAGVFDPSLPSGRSRIYVNGALAGASAAPLVSAMAPNSLNARIGAAYYTEVFNPGVNDRFAGLADEVQLYDRALSQAELQSIAGAGDAGVCLDRPVVAVADVAVTTTNTPFTFTPSANDRDPDVASPAVLATVPALPLSTPWLVGPGDVALVESTGLAYFTGGLQSSASPGGIGVLNSSTNTIAGSMPLPVKSNHTLSRVNQTTGIAYLRGSGLTAVDGRPGSPTFNQVILSLQLGNIQAMALDEPRGRLYLTSTTNATTSSLFQSRIILLDVDPASPTFHQVIEQGPAFGDGTALGIAVNSLTNKVYIAVNGGSASGVYAIDGETLDDTLVASTAGAQTVFVNDAANLIYAATGTSLYVIDGATDTRLALITLPAGGSAGTLDTRMAIHKATGKVFVRLAEFPNPSRLAVIDGNRTSPTFNTILTFVALGREDNAMVAVDEDANRVVATSNRDLETAVIDVTTNAVLATVPSTQSTGRITIDRVHHRAYVTGGIGFIQSIDLVNAILHATVPLGTETTFLAVNPVTHAAYVPFAALATGVNVVNGNGLAGTISLPHGDGRLLFAVANPDTNRIYVLNGGATAAGSSDALPGFVHVIDGATNQSIASVPVGPVPFGMGINIATNKIYVGNGFLQSGAPFGGGITVIDGATLSTVEADLSQIPRSSTAAGQISIQRDLVANPATGRVYFRITSGSTTSLGVLNGTTNVATPLPPFAGGATNIIRVNPVLNRIYVGEQVAGGSQTGRIHILDGANDQEIAVVAAGSPSAFAGTQSYLAVNRISGRVFVADFLTDSVAVIDPATNAISATVRVGDGPSAVAVHEALNRVYVASNYDKMLTIIDGATLRVVATLPMPTTAVRLDVDEAASLIFSTPGAGAEPAVMVISDPGTVAPAIVSVTDGAFGSVALNADGSVTYTPNADFSGSDSFTYSVPDGSGGFTSGTVNVTVAAPLTIVGELPDSEVDDTAYSHTLTATGGTGPYAWSVIAGSGPGGLALNGLTGVVSGMTTQAGTFTFMVQVVDLTTNATATRVYTVTVGPPVITTTSLPSGFVSTPYSATVVAGGATGDVQWTLDTGGSPLLSWLSISNAGVLSGTPPNAGTTPPFTVRATDSLAQVATRSLSIFVGAPLDISPTQLREGVVLETPASLPLVGGNGTRAVTLVEGTLPPGLTLNANGTFTGAPRRHGTFTFTVQATDCTPATTCLNTLTPQTVSRELTLRVSARDQQGSSQTQPAITIGGPGGRRVAQVVTVGAQGLLTGIGLNNITCPSLGPVSVEIQRLTENGLPDGTTIATGTAINNLLSAITVAPAVDFPIGAKFAFIVSSPTACTLNNAAVTDQYNAGDAYVDSGAGWASLFSTDGRYDVPGFRTLIQPAMDVGYLSAGRGAGATATLLANGTVLLTGNGANAEIYDPATNSTTLTGNMSTARTQHTATLLHDGTVLMVGGQLNGVRLATAETYDPITGTFSLTAGSMSVGRDQHRATRMNDGRVLITGGTINVDTASVAVATAEIYDPVSRTFTAAPNMTSTRQVHNSVLLQSGKVLVASGFIGGSSPRTAELYDPTANTFTATAGSMNTARGWSAAEMLADGRVLISGGHSGSIRSTAEIYDPVTDSFTTVGSMTTARQQHTMTLLADGSVLVAGGFDEVTVANYVLPLASMERFVPGSNSFVPAGAMEARHARHNAIRLPNDTVFLAGGAGQTWLTNNSGEIYALGEKPALLTTTVPEGQVGVAYPVTTLVATGGSGAPYQVALASGLLPPGLVLDGTTLSGTPTVNGAFPVGIRLTDSLNQSTVEALTIHVGAALVITTPYQLTTAVLNRPYDVQLTASHDVVWSLAPASGPLQAGLSLGADGRITGMATEFAGRTFSVRAVDALGRMAQKTFNISTQNPLAITSTVLPEAAVRENYNFCMSSQNGVTSNTWSISGGTLPAGVSLQSNGCFANPPSALGTSSFTVQITDLASPPQVVTRDFTIRVSAKEQQSGSTTQPAIAFGGGGGRRLAQTITVGASGTLTAFGFNSSVTCQAAITVDVQRLDAFGRPDGTTIASGSLLAGLGGIPISPLTVGIGDRIAFVLSSPGACTIANVPVHDSYHAGESFADAGSGWVSLVDSDGRYDIPFRSMIEPSNTVVFLHRARGNFAATVLGDGRVLMTGNGNTAEIFDPATRATTLTGNMSLARSGHTGTLLPDGTVLIAGGRDASGNRLATAEIYNPVTGAFTPTAAPMAVPHDEHTATLMNDGRVLIAGGLTQIGTVFQSIATAETYDPSTMTFSPAGDMLTARQEHTATLLADGRVLLMGGFTGGSVFRSAEIYNPITGTFTATTGNMFQTRGRAAIARLADGRILITGGQANDIVNTAEIYDPVTDTFTQTGSMLSPRQEHTATALADGSVLIAGGVDQSNSGDYILPLATMERWMPGTNSFVPAGSLVARHKAHTAAALPDGSVLIAGGFSQSWMTGQSAEIVDPAVSLALSPGALPDASPGVAYSVTFTPSGGTAPHAVETLSGVLPPGLSYNAATRTLSGTPTAVGAYTIGFRVTDSASHTMEQSFTLRVGSLNTITSPYRLTDASLDQPYAVQLTASGAGPITWFAGPPSNLPPGLVLSASGLISGTPTTQSYYNFAVRAVDANGQLAIKTLAINIVNPMTFATGVLPVGAAMESYTYCLSTSGGVGTKTFEVIGGALPPGVSLGTNGCFADAGPTTLGDFGFTVRVTDQSSVPQALTRSFDIRVAARDQSGSAQAGTTIFFGGAGGRRLAQTVTAGANGYLTAVGSFNVFCPAMSVEIQGVRPDGLPDGTTQATGSFQSNLSSIGGIQLTPAVQMTIGTRFAIVFTSATACDVTNAPATFDGYFAGDAYADTGSGWVPLATTDGRYDIPFRSLILPAVDLGFFRTSHSGHTATLLNDGRILVTGGLPEVLDPATNETVLTGGMSTTRFGFTATPLQNGTVLIAGGSVFSNNTTTYPTVAEIFNPATNTFTAVPGPMNFGRTSHAATLLADGTVLITGGFGQLSYRQAEIYNPVSQTFTVVGSMLDFRNSHSATLLIDGRVLIVGGSSSTTSAELYDPNTQTFSATGSSNVSRFSGFTSTLLADGRVLVVGGGGLVAPHARNSAELYHPATGVFTATGSMATARQFHTAAVLPDGSVLVSGGRQYSNAPRPVSMHERYLPASGTFVPAGGMVTQRANHTVTTIAGGRLVLIGGSSSSTLPGLTSEIYDQAAAPALTGVPLPDAVLDSSYAGVVLGASGGSGAPYTIALESGSLPPGLTFNEATRALGVNETPTAAGTYTVGMSVTDSAGHTSVEPLTIRVSPLDITTLSLPNPTIGTPYSLTLGATGVGAVSWSVFLGTLPAGLSLVGNTITGTPTNTTGTSFTLKAVDAAGQVTRQTFFLSVLLPPADQQSSWDTSQPAVTVGGATRLGQLVRTGITGNLFAVRPSNLVCPTGTTVSAEIQGLLPSGAPNGVTIASGSAAASTFANIFLSPQVFFAAETTFTLVLSTDQPCQMHPTTYDSYAGGDGFVFDGSWQRLSAFDGRYDIPFLTYVQPPAGLALSSRSRGNHTQTTLASGEVLLISGSSDQTAELYNPATGGFTVVGSLHHQRQRHTATLLFDGTVLITGGYNFTGPEGSIVYLASAEIYHPDTRTFELLPSTMAAGRYDHTATELTNGDVLIAGGSGLANGGSFGTWQSAEQYLTSSRTFMSRGNMQSARAAHTATLLPGGAVLLHGGYGGNSSELFNTNGTFAFTTGTPVVSFRARHTATLLNNGTVFIAGGSGSSANRSAELFNPATGAFAAAGSLLRPRVDHTSVLLADGSVLLAGGLDDSICCPLLPPDASMERYVPGGGFVGAGGMLVARYDHAASRLANGSVVMTGTYGWSSAGGRSAEIYSEATGVALVSTAAPNGQSGAAYAGFTLAGNGGQGSPYTMVHRSGALPNGLTYNSSTRTISGMPTESGTFTMTFTITDGVGNANSQTVTLRIDPLTITTTSLNNGQPGVPYSAQLAATGLAPITWSLVPGSSLPAGLTLNANGSITGTPTTSQFSSFSVRATDAVGQVAQRQLSLNVFLP